MRWAQQGNPSSHWTIEVSRNGFLVVLLTLTFFHLCLAAVIPPAEDELYYWAWSKALSLSYYDHPPLTAYLIRISTAIFGDSVWSIRLFACLGSFGTLWILGYLTDRKRLLYLLLVTPVVFYGSLLMTPDIPLAFFWIAYVAWLTRVNRRLSDWNEDPVARVYQTSPVPLWEWFLGGCLLGLGLLSKYTMVLGVPCTLLVLGNRYRVQAWWRGALTHFAVAILVSLPVWIFNARYGFEPFRFQWNHTVSGVGFSSDTFLNYLGSQYLLIGGLAFWMLPWVLLKFRELGEEPRYRTHLYFYAVPFVFFLFQSFRTRLEGNWAFISYLTFWPLADRIFFYSSFRGFQKLLLWISFIPPIFVTVFCTLHAIHPLKQGIPPSADRLGIMRAQYDASKRMASDLRDLPLSEVVALNYQWTSYLRFQGIEANQIFPEGRQSQFTLEKTPTCDTPHLFAVLDSSFFPSGLNCFSDRSLLKEYNLQVRGENIGKFQLWELKRH